MPCPCCGGRAEFDDYDDKNGQVLVRCVDCDLNTVPGSHEQAAAQWNRRPNGMNIEHPTSNIEHPTSKDGNHG